MIFGQSRPTADRRTVILIFCLTKSQFKIVLNEARALTFHGARIVERRARPVFGWTGIMLRIGIAARSEQPERSERAFPAGVDLAAHLGNISTLAHNFG